MKVTASGRPMNFKPSQRWHTVIVPSGFYWVDAMGAYRQVRTGQAEEQSYSLDAILKKHKLGGKLSFTQADQYTGLQWHMFMQQNYPLEYCVYNLWDSISMLELDEKTKDLQMSMPMFAGTSDFQHFNSQPRRAVDELHWFVMEDNEVIGSTASEMVDDNDSETIGVKGIITMLPSHLIVDNGLRIVVEDKNIVTNIRIGVADQQCSK